MPREPESAIQREVKGLRIAYVCTDPGVPILGQKGASVHVQEFIHALVKAGARVELFSSSVLSRAELESDGVVVHELQDWPKGKSSGLEASVESANQSLFTVLERSETLDLVYERYALWSYAGMEYAKSRNIPGLLEVDAPLIEEESKYRGLKNRPLSERVAHRVFRASRGIIGVSQGIASYLSQFQETAGKVRVVHNGVNPERFPTNLEPSNPAPAGVFTVGFVGSLKPWHGLETLADAYSILRNESPCTRLLIVGDGPERERLRESLAAKGLLDSCEFTGALKPSEVPALVASMDVGVAPYPTLNGFYFSPLKVFEYMAAGKPVVASRVGDLPNLIRDGVDGFLVPPSDSAALSRTLSKLMSDGQLRASVGSAARAKVLGAHTWDMVVRRVFDLTGLTTGPVQAG